MKNIIYILGLAAALVVGSKFYLEYQYKKELDNMLKGASMFADVTYKNLTVGFDGAVTLEGVRVKPNGSFDTGTVDEMKLVGLSIPYQFRAKSKLANGELPETVGIVVNGARFPSSVYENVYSEQECRSFWGTMRYSAAGFDDIVLNGRFDFDLRDPFAASFDFRGNDQISTSSFSINFNARQAGAMALATQNMPVQSMRYDLTLNEAAANSIIQHCADLFKVSPSVYLEKVVKSEKFMKNSFYLSLGDQASQAMADFFTGGKELVVRSTPSERLKSMEFAGNASPAQLIRLMNLTVSMDGTTVPIRTFATRGGQAAEADEMDAEGGFQRRDLDELLNSPDGTIQEKNRPTLSKKKRDNYEKASLSQLNKYIDREVRIGRTRERSALEGRLLGAKEGVVSIEMFRYGGVMTYTVPFGEISAFEVKKR